MPKQRRDDASNAYLKEMGSRLREVLCRFLGDDWGSAKIAQSLSTSPRSLDSWLDGKSSPDLYKLTALLGQLRIRPGDPYDCNYLFLGVQGKERETLDRQILEIREDIRDILDRLADVPVGLDGIASRLTLRLLDELRTNHKSGLPLNEPLVAGVIMDREILAIEPHSVHTRLLTLTLDYGAGRDGDGSLRSGRFLTMIAENIVAGRRYTYILPGTDDQWQKPVKDLEDKLFPIAGNKVRQYIEFRTTAVPVGAGFVLMELDFAALKREKVALAAELADQKFNYMTSDLPNMLGEVMPASRTTRGGMLMDAPRLKAAVAAWEALMAQSRVLSR